MFLTEKIMENSNETQVEKAARIGNYKPGVLAILTAGLQIETREIAGDRNARQLAYNTRTPSPSFG